jgi:acetolactate synthase regulatory subunit
VSIQLRFLVETSGTPEALIRVLTILRRRRAVVTHVEYSGAGPDAPGRLELSVEAHPRLAAQLEPWLSNLVEVTCVAPAEREPAGAYVRKPRATSSAELMAP